MKRFEFVPTFLLSLVTCGIYALYVWFKMSDANNTIGQKYGNAPVKGFIIAMLLGCVTCGIYLYYWYYKYAELQIKNAKASGVSPAPTESPIVMMLLYFVPVYSFYVLCDNYNRTIDAN